MKSVHVFLAVFCGLFTISSLIGARIIAPAGAAMLPVAGASFESPNSLAQGGIFPEADGWIETGPVGGPAPDFPGFEVPPGGPFTLNTGVFFNSPVTNNPTPPPAFIANPSFVTNADGLQLAYLFAKDDAEISFQQTLQDVYQPDTTYTFTIALGKSFFLPPLNLDGGEPTMEIRLVYEDDAGQSHSLAQTPITAAEVANTTLTDFAVSSGALPVDHPAIGASIRLWIDPTQGTSGVWILDNARVTAVPEPAVLTSFGVLAWWFAFGKRRRRSDVPASRSSNA